MAARRCWERCLPRQVDRSADDTRVSVFVRSAQFPAIRRIVSNASTSTQSHRALQNNNRRKAMLSRRLFLQSSAASAAYLASGVWAAWAANAPGVTDTEIKIGQTMPYSGPAVGLWVIGQDRCRLFQDDQRDGRRERPQDQSHQPGRWLQPAQDRRADPPAGRTRAGRLHFRQCWARRQPGDPAYLNDNKVPQLFVSTGASMFGDPQHFPWTIGWRPNYQTEAHIYAKHILADEARREDRRAVPERRLRQGLSDRARGRPRRRITPP